MTKLDALTIAAAQVSQTRQTLEARANYYTANEKRQKQLDREIDELLECEQVLLELNIEEYFLENDTSDFNDIESNIFL